MDIFLIAGIIILVIIAIMIILTVIWFVSSYNMLIRMQNVVNEAFVSLNKSLQSRYEVIAQLVKIIDKNNIQGANFEALLQAKDVAMASKDLTEQLKNETYFIDQLCLFEDFVEKQQVLSDDEEFGQAYKNYKDLNEDISYSQKYYNGVAKSYNERCTTFPANLLAKWFKLEQKPYFENKDE